MKRGRRYIQLAGGRQWRLRIEFVPQDAWIGAYWKSEGTLWSRGTDWPRHWRRGEFNLYICLLPFLPIHFRWWRA